MSGGPDGTTKIWSADARHNHQMLEGPNVLLGFIGDGRRLIAASIKAVSVWTPDSGARVDFPVPTNLPISSVTLPPFQVKPREPLAALGRGDGIVELWNLETGDRGTGWPAHKETIGVVAFSPDGKWLATGTLQGEIKIWEFATRREVPRIGPIGRKLLSLAFSPDGKTVAASGESGIVWLWEAATGREVVQLPGHGTVVPSVAFSPDGQTLATASLDNDARVWEVPSGKLRTTLRGHVEGVIAVAFSPDGKTIATGSHDRKVKLWDVATHQELATFSLGGLFPTLGFSPDGRILAVGNVFEARIDILSAPSFEEIQAARKSGADAK
jgi:WD40 repeat protein